jgi:hypothetical protein
VAEVRVGVLSIGRGDGGPPLSAPVWYVYEPGGDIVMNIGVNSEKARLLGGVGEAQYVHLAVGVPPASIGRRPMRPQMRTGVH